MTQQQHLKLKYNDNNAIAGSREEWVIVRWTQTWKREKYLTYPEYISQSQYYLK